MAVLAIMFGLLGGLLLWLLVGARGAWPEKALLVLVVASFAFVVWRSLASLDGWPASARPPDRAVLVASSVDEPRWIYLWLLPEQPHGLLGYRPASGEPRAYRVRYSRRLHEQLERARRLARIGARVELRRGRGPRGSLSRGTFRAYRLPPGLPPKTSRLIRAA